MMHAPVNQHPIFDTISQRIETKDYKVVVDDTDNYMSRILIYFKTGFRKWIVAIIDYASWYEGNIDGIRSINFYVKPGFMQFRERLDDGIVPDRIRNSIRSIASDRIISKKKLNRRARNNRLANALDSL